MTDLSEYLAIIREHSQPMDPLPTGMKPVLKRLPDIKAVLFDVYGTLFVSASGELGMIDDAVFEKAFGEALNHVGIDLVVDPGHGAEQLRATIVEAHDRLRATRVEFPEIDIAKVWKSTLRALLDKDLIRGPVEGVDVSTLALEFEVRANPVWPMPGAQPCLTELSARGLAVGVVSNGQWFTPMLFPALLGGCLETLGIAHDLQLWSYQSGEAKPGLTLYRQARAALAERDIPPEKVLFVGNDMLSDIQPAAAMGFKTALFAGDSRSLRLRAEDARVSGTNADIVVLNLLDIVRCVRPGE